MAQQAPLVAADLLARLQESASRHRVRSFRVFGSVARGQAGPSSDVDFLLLMEPESTLHDMLDFQKEAEALLGRKVDVLSEEGLDPTLHRRIFEQARPLVPGLAYPRTEEPGVEDSDYLAHIQRAIERIQEFTAGMEFAAYDKDAKSQGAVERQLTIIGEAVHGLSDELKGQNPDIPWGSIYRLRNVLVHFYVGVDHRKVWNVVENELPRLRERVAELLGRDRNRDRDSGPSR